MPGARVFTGNRSGAYEIHQQFAAYPGERLYGLGQRTHGRLNLKGLALDLVQRNGEVSIPFVLSDRGYGLLWNVPAVGRVEFAGERAPAGRPARPARSTTGSPRRRPRRRSSPGTRTPPVTCPSCPRGPAGSGSPSSATARRTSC